MNRSFQERNRSNLYGLVALVIAVIGLITPIFLLPKLFIAVAAFALMGLAVDRTKLFSSLVKK